MCDDLHVHSPLDSFTHMGVCASRQKAMTKWACVHQDKWACVHQDKRPWPNGHVCINTNGRVCINTNGRVCINTNGRVCIKTKGHDHVRFCLLQSQRTSVSARNPSFLHTSSAHTSANGVGGGRSSADTRPSPPWRALNCERTQHFAVL